MITLHSALTIAIAAKLPILLWGAPGSGKTSMITALAHDLDLPLEVVVGSIHEPSDFTGLPVVRETTTWFAPPHWAERLAKQGRGILFLDELTTAPPAVQAAMLRIVLEKTVGHLRLPPHVRIIAAANPSSVAADGWDLAAPLANRFIHLQWQPTATDIATGFISGFPRFTSLKAVSPNAAQIAAAKTHIGTFLRVRPQLVSVIPDSPDRAGQAWPSPRTWEMAAIAVATSWARNSSRLP